MSRGAPTRDDLYAAVGEIDCMAGHAECERLLAGRRAEKNTLDPPGDEVTTR